MRFLSILIAASLSLINTIESIPCPFYESACGCQVKETGNFANFSSVYCDFNGTDLPKFDGTPGQYLIEGVMLIENFVGDITSETFSVFESIWFLHLKASNVSGLSIDWQEDAFAQTRVQLLITERLPNMLPIPKAISKNLGHSLEKLSVIGLPNESARLTQKTFENLTSLTALLIENIKLEIDQDAFAESMNLTDVSLINADLREFPTASLQRLIGLISLNLTDNPMNLNGSPFLPFDRLTTLILKRVDLTGKDLPEVFDGLANLEFLDLTGTSLQTIPGTVLKKFQKLVTLLLSDNRIESISSGDFPVMNNLEHLFLDNNNITNVSSDAFADLKSLVFLGLKTSNLHNFELSLLNGMESLYIVNLERTVGMIISAGDFEKIPRSLITILAPDGDYVIDPDINDYFSINQHCSLSLSNSIVVCDESVSWMAAYIQCGSTRISHDNTMCSNQTYLLEEYLLKYYPVDCHPIIQTTTTEKGSATIRTALRSLSLLTFFLIFVTKFML